jgi:hypothetical protein
VLRETVPLETVLRETVPLETVPRELGAAAERDIAGLALN